MYLKEEWYKNNNYSCWSID